MSINYTVNKQLQTPSQGATPWTTPVNGDFTLLDQILGSYVQIAASGPSQSLSYVNSQYQRIVITGVLTQNFTLYFPTTTSVGNDVIQGGQWLITNLTTGNYTVSVSLGVGTASVTCSQGGTTSVYMEVSGLSGIASGMYLASPNVGAGGSPGQVQVNSGGQFSGSSGLTFSNNTLTANAIVSSTTANITGALSAGSATITGDVTAATFNTRAIGTAANNILALDSSSKIPAVDGSQLTSLNGSQISALSNSASTTIRRGASTLVTGSAVDFTGIPSWARRITVLFNSVYYASGGYILVQLGSTTAGFVTANYNSVSVLVGGGSNQTGSDSTGFIVYSGATETLWGAMYINNMTGNVWVETHDVIRNTYGTHTGAGAFNPTGFAGPVDRVRITLSSGSFYSGSVNVMWE